MICRYLLPIFLLALITPVAAHANGVIVTDQEDAKKIARLKQAVILSDQSVWLPSQKHIPSHLDVKVEYNDIVRAAVSETSQADSRLYWHHQNDGVGSLGADINSPLAWSYSLGVGQTVAVIDSGVNGNIDELKNQMWQNPKELDNGLDDDSNGIVDDLNGAEMSLDGISGRSTDQFGHGTQVASLIAARADNGGIVGVAPAAKIMSVRILNSAGTGTEATLIAGIDYALKKGAKIINLSLISGASSPSPGLSAIMDQARQSGALVIVAAGNSGKNIDQQPVYPASLAGNYIISVGASDSKDIPSTFSNFGKNNVDLFAPGEEVPVINQDGGIQFSSGTSMATPITAASAALVWARNKNLSAEQLRQVLIASVDKKTAMTKTSLSGGRLNVGRAVDGAGKVRVATILTSNGDAIKRNKGMITLKVRINSPSVLHRFYLDGKLFKSLTPKQAGSLILKIRAKRGRHTLLVKAGVNPTLSASRIFNVK